MFSKKGVDKTARYHLNSTTPIGIMNEITWKTMCNHKFTKMWFGEEGSAQNKGFLYYYLPNDVGLPGLTESDNCNSLNSVLDILDVS
jgi:hypothetical protein